MSAGSNQILKELDFGIVSDVVHKFWYRFSKLIGTLKLRGRCWLERGVFILAMLQTKTLASKINDEIRSMCQKLDESAAFVRKEAPEDADGYAIAIAKIFETITSELLVPLYREHPDIAPPIWHEMNESKE